MKDNFEGSFLICCKMGFVNVYILATGSALEACQAGNMDPNCSSFPPLRYSKLAGYYLHSKPKPKRQRRGGEADGLTAKSGQMLSQIIFPCLG